MVKAGEIRIGDCGKDDIVEAEEEEQVFGLEPKKCW
jgi:hypothetical protein